MPIKVTPYPEKITKGSIWIARVAGRGKKWPTLGDIPHERYNVCKAGGLHGAQLSPMKLGPVIVDGELFAYNIEDAWQCLKVSKKHLDEEGNPSKLWFEKIYSRRLDGLGLRRRYPKNTPIAYSYFQENKLGYVDARKATYIPWYMDLVQKTDAFEDLYHKHLSGINLLFLEYDAPENPSKMTL